MNSFKFHLSCHWFLTLLTLKMLWEYLCKFQYLKGAYKKEIDGLQGQVVTEQGEMASD